MPFALAWSPETQAARKKNAAGRRFFQRPASVLGLRAIVRRAEFRKGALHFVTCSLLRTRSTCIRDRPVDRGTDGQQIDRDHRLRPGLSELLPLFKRVESAGRNRPGRRGPQGFHRTEEIC